MKKGFTLIELLVGMTIIAIVFTIGVASYREFSRRQELLGVIKSTESDLRLIQQLAFSGQKPTSGICTRLDSYTFKIESSSSYSLTADCFEGPVEVKLKELSNVSISATENPITFKVLGSGTNLSSSDTLTITSDLTGNSGTLTVGVGGDIK